MNYKKIIIVLLIIVCLIIAFYSMKGVLTPYVSFKEAMLLNKYVQVIGRFEKSAKIEYDEGYFTFSMVDDVGTMMKILYRGSRPLNFEHAKQVVALGRYSAADKIFEAEKILVKCPSKYTKEN